MFSETSSTYLISEFFHSNNSSRKVIHLSSKNLSLSSTAFSSDLMTPTPSPHPSILNSLPLSKEKTFLLNKDLTEYKTLLDSDYGRKSNSTAADDDDISNISYFNLDDNEQY